MYIHGRKKVLSSRKIITAARNNIHLYPIGDANSYCFNPLKLARPFFYAWELPDNATIRIFMFLTHLFLAIKTIYLN
jgi:hypothetical protein